MIKLNLKTYVNFANCTCFFLIFTVSFTTKQKVEIKMQKIWYSIWNNSMVYRVKTPLSPGKVGGVQEQGNLK